MILMKYPNLTLIIDGPPQIRIPPVRAAYRRGGRAAMLHS